jgi:hypothetical protein
MATSIFLERILYFTYQFCIIVLIIQQPIVSRLSYYHRSLPTTQWTALDTVEPCAQFQDKPKCAAGTSMLGTLDALLLQQPNRGHSFKFPQRQAFS